jgi:hypothetical protein
MAKLPKPTVLSESAIDQMCKNLNQDNAIAPSFQADDDEKRKKNQTVNDLKMPSHEYRQLTSVAM